MLACLCAKLDTRQLRYVAYRRRRRRPNRQNNRVITVFDLRTVNSRPSGLKYLIRYCSSVTPIRTELSKPSFRPEQELSCLGAKEVRSLHSNAGLVTRIKSRYRLQPVSKSLFSDAIYILRHSCQFLHACESLHSPEKSFLESHSSFRHLWGCIMIHIFWASVCE